MDPVWLALPGCFVWLIVAALPWRPWSTRERLDAGHGPAADVPDLSAVTVLIPAREERSYVARTLKSVAAQGPVHRIVLVDDQSTDGTAEAALACGLDKLLLVPGSTLPAGWTGKMWALEQGRKFVDTPAVLLLDADIELRAGTLDALLSKMRTEDLALVSLMARLRMRNFWEKLLMPAFIYFFKLLYPFRLSNSESRLVAAAAGGCILMRSDVLKQLGGFDAVRNEIIDDCALARRVKAAGLRTWLGLTHSAVSQRHYEELRSIWDMVARTAYAQLRYSPVRLTACSFLMALVFVVPLTVLFLGDAMANAVAAPSLLLMMGTYLPTLRYYGLSPLWSAAMPLIAVLFLLMTWTSAWRHWRGTGAQWKNRAYSGATKA